MIERGLELFDRLIVAIGDNPAKSYTFSIDERLRLLDAAVPSCERLTIAHFSNRYLVDYAREMEANIILRGIRSPDDYEYERVMRHINADLAPKITTTFLMPPRDIAEVSSSMVKSLIGPEGWQETVRRYVPAPVFAALEKQLDA
jgi:pantetheine-phosphate adenylyltransferase